jgi:hypothetical protein
MFQECLYLVYLEACARELSKSSLIPVCYKVQLVIGAQGERNILANCLLVVLGLFVFNLCFCMLLGWRLGGGDSHVARPWN